MPLPAGQPRDRADPLQPADRGQAGPRQARAADRSRDHAAQAAQPRSLRRTSRHPLPGRRARPSLQPCRVARLHREGSSARARSTSSISSSRYAAGTRSTHPAGDTTSCTWPVGQTADVVRIAAHMHLLGVSMRVVLNPGTPRSQGAARRPELRLQLPALLQPEHARARDPAGPDPGQLHLQPEAPPGDPLHQGPAAAVHHLGRRVRRRDVPGDRARWSPSPSGPLRAARTRHATDAEPALRLRRH